MQDKYTPSDFTELLTRGDTDQLLAAIKEHGSDATGFIDKLIVYDDELVRAAAVALIVQLGLTAYKPLLLKACEDPCDLVRTDALTALFEMGHPLDEFFASADRLSLDPSPDVRSTTLAMLYVVTANEQLLEPLSRLLLDANCQYHTQYAVLNIFTCYLNLIHHPGVVKLLKAVRHRLADSMDLAKEIDEVLAEVE